VCSTICRVLLTLGKYIVSRSEARTTTNHPRPRCRAAELRHAAARASAEPIEVVRRAVDRFLSTDLRHNGGDSRLDGFGWAGALTQVLVGDGDTTVIGGIYVSREQASQDRTPGLHRIPLLGWLFQRNEFSDESRELLIFITPKISRL